MFTRGEQEEAVTDFVDKNKVNIQPAKTSIDREIEELVAYIDSEV